ncbi:hypothetical protein TeGR_g715, partial [Tetraparma gracilis]
YEEHIGGSPYTYFVSEGLTDPDSCLLDFNPSVFPRDEYNNKVTAATEGFAVTLTALGVEYPAVPFSHSTDYKGEIEIPANLQAKITLAFTLNNVLIGDGEVVEIVVTPPPDESISTNTYIAIGGVAVLLLLVGAFFYRRHQLRAAAQLKQVELEMAGRDIRFSEQRKEMEQDKQNLEAEKDQLEEEMRRKKHSEEELKVMVEALQSVSKERQDELKEVMVDSKEVTVDRILGKGGFGVVNLATYRGTKVAMKQLLTVTEENVLRFRHECFLMKNLSHPNVVKLVGVCWSEDMFACLLDFVENGSLEDWLRQVIEASYTASLELLAVAADKEALCRRFYLKKKDGDGYDCFSSTSYAVDDENKPASAGRERTDMIFCTVVREAAGTEGKQSEVLVLSIIDPKVSESEAQSILQTVVETPLVDMKRNVENVVASYKPDEGEEQGDVNLTWKGHLWKMALEAAMGVQYLHQHRSC